MKPHTGTENSQITLGMLSSDVLIGKPLNNMDMDEPIRAETHVDPWMSHVVLDSLTANVAVLDHHGVILFVNQAWKRFARENGADSMATLGVGANYLETTRCARGPCSAEAGAAWQGIQAVLTGSIPEFNLKYPCHSSDRQRWFLLQVTPLVEPDFGAAVVFHQDITARELAEQALVESQMRLAQAVQASRVGPWDWDLVTGAVHYSREWLAQIGREAEPPAPTLAEWEGWVHPEDRDRFQAGLKDCLASPAGSVDLEYRLLHRDGSYRWMNSRGQLFRDGAGRPGRILGCQLDVTERKSLEDQFRHAQRMESVGRLAGGVAHDFNNLLTIILGYSDLLLGGRGVDQHTRDSLGEIKKAGERAAALTGQLLAFSRKQVLVPAVLDLNQVVADCEKMLRRLLGADVDLITRLAPNLGRITADAGQLEQVLLNLVINARDAMPQGGRLTIETSPWRQTEGGPDFPGLKPGHHVVLRVTDTGMGMDEATRSRVFEPFFTTKEQGKGTGLGLAMVFGFIKQSGGHISVVSAPGQGCCFTIILPVTEFVETPESAAQPGHPPATGSETILLVEDEPSVRELARKILHHWGFDVLVASRGDEALALARTHPGPIHLLITDVVMPGMGGPRLAEAVQALHPAVKTLYISGYTDDTVIRHGIQHSDTAFLQKPFSIEALPAKARKVLDR